MRFWLLYSSDFSVGERFELTQELSVAAWAKIGVVHDPSKPMDKTIRKIPFRK